MNIHALCAEYDSANGIYFKTSGSTGEPKTIYFTKQQIALSAKRTASFFQLNEGDHVFSALPLEYVAGKMMALRAHILNWNLTYQRPTSLPIIDQSYKWAVFTPHQFINLFEKTPHVFSNLQCVLLGGGPFVDNEILKRIHEIPSMVFLGYGMTETLTHIAIRNLSKGERDYLPLDGVEVFVDDKQVLTIQDHLLNIPRFQTDDLAVMVDGRFQIIGRKSLVINTGGVKVFPEKIEEKIAAELNGDYYITSQIDKTLGECVVLVSSQILTEEQRNRINALLDKFEKPKFYIHSEQIEKTPSGKIIRKKIEP